MAGTFWLKYRDTRPVFQVVLHDPAPAGGLGPVHDLAGSTSWFMHMRLADGSKLKRTMTKVGVDADGTLQYTWVTTDWDAPSNPDADGSFQVGGLVKGGARLEYEVLGPASARLTFPNDESANDTLRITSDVGQA